MACTRPRPDLAFATEDEFEIVVGQWVIIYMCVVS